MSHYTGWRILQIIPAQPGWKAVHGQQTEDKKIEISTRPIICWGLVEGGEKYAIQTEVRGIGPSGFGGFGVVDDFLPKTADDFDDLNELKDPEEDWNIYFLGYEDPNAERQPDDWVKTAQHRIELERERRLLRMNELKIRYEARTGRRVEPEES